MTNTCNYACPVTRDALLNAILFFNSSGQGRTVGMEAERFILKEDGTLPNAEEHEAFYRHLRYILNDRVSVEPGAHQIEVKTDVHSGAAGLKADLQKSFASLEKIAFLHGFRVVADSDLPQFPVEALRRNLIKRHDPETGKVRRAYEQMIAYERHSTESIGRWGASTVSIQFTHSVKCAEALLRWRRVHAALSPLYFTVFENRERTDGTIHEGVRKRRELGGKGLVSTLPFEATDGEELARLYVDAVYDNVLLTVLDEKGQDKILEAPTAFRDLPPVLQTLGNFLQAASFAWNNSKVKLVFDEEALRDKKLVLSNLLLEARDIDYSDDGIAAVADWFADLTQSDINLAYIESALEECGVPVLTDPARAKSVIEASLHGVETRPQYLETPFGNGTLKDAIETVCLPIAREKSARFWEKALSSNGPPCRISPNVVETAPLIPRNLDWHI